MEYTEGVRFDSLGLSPEIMRAIGEKRIEVSTPVQAGIHIHIYVYTSVRTLVNISMSTEI